MVTEDKIVEQGNVIVTPSLSVNQDFSSVREVLESAIRNRDTNPILRGELAGSSVMLTFAERADQNKSFMKLLRTGTVSDVEVYFFLAGVTLKSVTVKNGTDETVLTVTN